MDFMIGVVTGALAVWIWFSARKMARLSAQIGEAESRLARRVYTLQGRMAELSATVHELDFERRRSRGLIRFAPDMRLEDAFDVHPRVREVFAAFGVGGGGCSGGSVDESRTIADVCRDSSLDSRSVLAALDRFVRDPDGPIEAKAASARIHQIRTLPPSRN
ncbi:MAG: hypothetical protein R3B81_13590 [bacterium]|nr:hypothetical protein [Gemmatimonadota bacterium]